MKTQIELMMSAAGLEKLKLAAEHMRQGAEHLDAAHALFLGLRDSGDLVIQGDISGEEARREQPAAAVIG